MTRPSVSCPVGLAMRLESRVRQRAPKIFGYAGDLPALVLEKWMKEKHSGMWEL